MKRKIQKEKNKLNGKRKSENGNKIEEERQNERSFEGNTDEKRKIKEREKLKNQGDIFFYKN